MSKNEDFLFLMDLSEDLYKRYLMIEDALKNTNGNVYVEMQAFLEHLFRYISKREKINLHQTTLGDCLKHHHVIKFCLVRIEYENIDLLKLINTYGNHYKHQKVIDFNFDEFIKCMREIYIISRKVYNYYKKEFINQYKMFDKDYFHNLIQEEKKKQEQHDLIHTKMNYLSRVLIQKNEEILLLNKRLCEREIKLKKLEKSEKQYIEELNQLKKINHSMKDKLEKIQHEYKAYKSELKLLRDKNKCLEKENLKLRDYQIATKEILTQLVKKNEPILDEEVIDMLKTKKHI